MKVFLFALTVVSIFAGSNASAIEYWEACNGCTPYQKTQQARAVAPANANGEFDVFMMDYHAETLLKYRVTSFFEPWEGLNFTAVRSVPVPDYQAEQFALDLAQIKAVVESIEDVEIPPDVIGTAYDIVFDPGSRQSVADYISHNLGFFDQFTSTVLIPTVFVANLIKVDVVYISVRFPDGSRARYQLVGLESDNANVLDFEYLEGSAREPDGNFIPEDDETAQSWQGRFTTPARAERMRHFIDHWFTGGFKNYVCSSSANGNETIVTCRRIPIVGR
ncbi:MAG: hypothetical protein AAF004_03085 [Pseudomonadota bacterium]